MLMSVTNIIFEASSIHFVPSHSVFSNVHFNIILVSIPGSPEGHVFFILLVIVIKFLYAFLNYPIVIHANFI